MKKILSLHLLLSLGFILSAQELAIKEDTYVDRLFYRPLEIGEPQGKTNQELIAKWDNYFSTIEAFQKPIREGWERISKGNNLKMIDSVCMVDTVPFEITVFLALIESGWKKGARSKAGAAGWWQFMPETARLCGLIVNSKTDERLDKKKSTVAAIRHLRDLYNLTHTWSKNKNITESDRWHFALVMYNRGKKKVKPTFLKTEGKFFKYPRVLPATKTLSETRNFVPKIFGARRWKKKHLEGGGKIFTDSLMADSITADSIKKSADLFIKNVIMPSINDASLVNSIDKPVTSPIIEKLQTDPADKSPSVNFATRKLSADLTNKKILKDPVAKVTKKPPVVRADGKSPADFAYDKYRDNKGKMTKEKRQEELKRIRKVYISECPKYHNQKYVNGALRVIDGELIKVQVKPITKKSPADFEYEKYKKYEKEMTKEEKKKRLKEIRKVYISECSKHHDQKYVDGALRVIDRKLNNLK